MHLGYTGPRVLLIDPEGYPVQPYGFKENPNTVLDVADIVYVNPVNVGYSRVLDEKTPRETFFGVNADIKYLAGWISTFVTRKGRWQSPKYLIGEATELLAFQALLLNCKINNGCFEWGYPGFTNGFRN